MGLQNDLLASCNNQTRASIINIYLSGACNITSMTAVSSAMAFSAVTMDSTSDVFYKYEFEPFTMDLTGESENENGTATFTYTINGKVKGIDKSNLQRLQDVVDERKITAIIEVPNSTGTYNRAFVVGWDNIIGDNAAANVTVSSLIEAALNGDNSATLSLSATHAEQMRELVGSIETNSGTVNFGS